MFQLHLPGGPYPFHHSAVFAFLSACGEVTFPVLLVLGLGTRFAATGLILMTCIIELTVPEGWPIHLTRVAMAPGIAAWGPGRYRLTICWATGRSGREPVSTSGTGQAT